MSRTVEKTLSWIGVGLQVASIVVVVILSFLFNSSNKFIQEGTFEGEELTAEEVSFFSSILGTGFYLAIFVLVVLLILGILGALWIDKKLKGAAILLIVAGAVSLVTFNVLVGILWLAAGIMLLVKKPKPELQQEAVSNVERELNK